MAGGWVCPECGLDYDTVSASDAVVALRSYPRRYRQVLEPLAERDDGDEVLRRRPEPDTWSVLEYTAHVADLMPLMAEIFTRMVREDDPSLGFWDPDERAAERAYNEMPLADVLAELKTGCEAAAAAAAKAGPEDWSRQGGFPWGQRDLLTMVRNAVHEGSHHLRDVESVAARVT